ncbi:FKBP-type peptidyl-prolyl cis-trans isomerase [Ancylomarina sp.]|uniref:FKBP-type peptidyl-prolyl cis-trans isomerase n=1 Tax=Ancylomarina sp. TaxID=1970196 RepID=UPI003568919C
MKKYRYKHQNEEETKAYIKKNKLDAQKSDSGLYYVVSKEGEGKKPSPDSNVTIAYMGYLTNGDTFDQNERFEVNLSEVVAGWTEGIQYFKEGGEGILLIPSHLAYGNDDYGNIPGGSVLIFDIQLIKVD